MKNSLKCCRLAVNRRAILLNGWVCRQIASTAQDEFGVKHPIWVLTVDVNRCLQLREHSNPSPCFTEQIPAQFYPYYVADMRSVW